jgi:hypothetical protein
MHLGLIEKYLYIKVNKEYKVCVLQPKSSQSCYPQIRKVGLFEEPTLYTLITFPVLSANTFS